MRQEPSIKKSTCSYCGDAPINHFFSYCESLISITLDGYTTNFPKYVPSFLEHFANYIPVFLFKTLVFFKLAKFSSDINKANTFRSRVIWEEAIRRGIKMEQIILLGKPLDYYHALFHGKDIYFDSIPIPPSFMKVGKNWDDKAILKKEFIKKNIPVPDYFQLPLFRSTNIEQIFSKFKKPIIVKPKMGSRGRHTTTNINTITQLQEGIGVVRQICPYVVVEEHLAGDVCRATLINGVLAGFYKGRAPFIIGDGVRTIKELIEEKDKIRPDRVERIWIDQELNNHISRAGFTLDDILPKGVFLSLSHRVGRLFGGTTKEMIDELHPSFIPILEQAAHAVELAVAGFDCIIPDPTKPASTQRWGIIECNSLPFIDLHYYALEGKPRNIAGMIWDLWN
ncbi:hypothetical protein COU49_01980 [Candidatus Nomurabacteria bacterium CG10_big_fil_rev_8_21_14_0_10_35_16]|uniref:ATP-grasp domain-containing protein n=1 Tax=Candidatus Nomurabacteria bacterium CG10_big_fil_rev_8_21_14_0_10_35_16 TaxID=1974731 RepID=A0A2H0TBE2_9BACT|nr:MAG: hypothetical protein COU49_01980 [Candidatus Nomurabacteria bacterium CG10_big_fil_rev_8_21_14_0_10_35_16]